MAEHPVASASTGTDTSLKHFDARWYAAYTRSRHEKRVQGQLQAKSVECFLPLYTVTSRWKDRNVSVLLPLFPGYVFVHIDIRDRMRVLQSPGIVRLVGQENKPEPLPETEINALRTALMQKISVEPHPLLRAGEPVLIKSGPFEGLEGILLRKNRLRVVLSLAQIHSSFVLDVDALDVEPVRSRPTIGSYWQSQRREISNIGSSSHHIETRG